MNTINKAELLSHFDHERATWLAMKDKPQNVMHDKFIEDVILVLDWVLSDIENM